MGKLVTNAVLDGALAVIATATEMYICTEEPADRAAAISDSLIDAVTLDGDDFTVADGTSGRKVTVGQQASIAITATGTASHVVLCTGSALVLVTTCTPQELTSGGTVTVPEFIDQIADPT